MKRLALVVAMLGTTAAHADYFIDEYVWFLSDQPFKTKRPEIAELIRERYELGQSAIVATTVETYRTDAAGHVTHTERRTNPRAPREIEDITYDGSDRIERIHWVSDQVAHDEVLTYEGGVAKSVIDGVEQRPESMRSSHISFTIDGKLLANSASYVRRDDHYDAHGYPDRIEGHTWNNVYDRAGRLMLSGDGTVTRLYFWNSRGDLAEVAEKWGGRVVAKTVYTYVYR